MIAEPRDFIGNILAKLINNRLENPLELERVKKWRMSVILETDYYPISIIFEDQIGIEATTVDDPTLIFRMKFQTIVSIVKKETSILRALIHGSIRVKGIIQHPRAAFRFYKLMNLILK
ncbi:hypothetical protein EU527_13110 [Candidatus Thorarchaeota archaeon]|nr:MAG: hypothetical protein EU527_13110 [Candidatus Thorarchaeota archaeon]